MNHSESEDLLLRVINQYGAENQILMAIEKSAEFTKILIHSLKGKSLQSDVAEKIADVLIMALQMRLIFGCDEVDRKVKEKSDKLRKQLNDKGGKYEFI